ncbi:MAG TPA: lipid II flippase MurJ, partial [Burkholderiaceae bacterium]|nr:lipid II flippase MurJ [Burkholderiaceae bacterium]
PTALLGVALGVVLIPQLSAAQARGDPVVYSGLIDWGLRLVLLLALPCSMALVLFAQPLLAVLFHYGRFTAEDVAQTVLPLRGYGCGLLGIVGVKVLAPGYFAQLDIRTPVRIAMMVLVCTQLLNLFFIAGLGWGVGALATSIGLGAVLNAGWLLTGLLRRGLYRPQPGWAGFAARVALATLALGAGLAWAAQAIDWIGLRAHPFERAGLMAAVLGGVAALYFAVLAACGLDLRQFARRTH